MSSQSFPFVGAGEASYFEWAAVSVCFTRAPSASEAQAIGDEIPVPLRARVTCTGPLLSVASEQGVGRTIAAAYAKSPKTPAALTTRGKHTIAPDAAYRRFDADIERWLRAAHTVVPIRVAFRAEDHEAGGTKLSDWHRESVRALPAILAEIASVGEGEVATLGVQLCAVARAAGVRVEDEIERRFAERHAAAEAAEDEARSKRWDALADAAVAMLGAPAPRWTVTRADLDPALLRGELPATAKRLARLAPKGLALRPGASEAAIAAAEAALGVRLSAAHRALLGAFDGGQIGEITFLGTPGGGAVGDADVVTFSRAWCGDELRWIIVARTARENVIAVPAAKPGPVFLFHGKPGWGGSTTRQCKTLDIALDLAIKAGKVWNNMPS